MLGLAHLIPVRYNIHGEKSERDERECKSIRMNYKDAKERKRVKEMDEK